MSGYAQVAVIWHGIGMLSTAGLESGRLRNCEYRKFHILLIEIFSTGNARRCPFFKNQSPGLAERGQGWEPRKASELSCSRLGLGLEKRDFAPEDRRFLGVATKSGLQPLTAVQNGQASSKK